MSQLRGGQNKGTYMPKPQGVTWGMAKHTLFEKGNRAERDEKQMWYVVQVRSGTEEEIKAQCRKVVDQTVLQGCFIPYFIGLKRYLGAWHREKKILFPGYVFMITNDVERLFLELKKVYGLTKLIGVGTDIVPLTEEEINFLKICGKKEMIVDMSVGIIKDGGWIIQQGPLQGFEDHIKKIDRHKRRAYLELTLGEKRCVAQVGLEVTEKS